jgi:hypothetical protein
LIDYYIDLWWTCKSDNPVGEFLHLVRKHNRKQQEFKDYRRDYLN